MKVYTVMSLAVFMAASSSADEWKPSYPTEARYMLLDEIKPQPRTPEDWVLNLTEKYGLKGGASEKIVAGLTKPASVEICNWASAVIKSGTFDTPAYVFALAILARAGEYPGESTASKSTNTENTLIGGGPLLLKAIQPQYRYDGLANSLWLYISDGKMTGQQARFHSKLSEEDRNLLTQALGETKISDLELTRLKENLKLAKQAGNSTAEIIVRHALINQTGDIGLAVEGLKSEDAMMSGSMAISLSWLGRPEAVAPLLEAARYWENHTGTLFLHFHLLDSLSHFEDAEIVKYFATTLQAPNQYDSTRCHRVIVAYLSRHLEEETARQSLIEYFSRYKDILDQMRPAIDEINRKYPLRPEDK